MWAQSLISRDPAHRTPYFRLAGIRLQADIENLGGVAALAAAKAVKENKTPRRIDVGELQARLIKEGLLPKDVPGRKLKPNRYSDAELRRLVDALLVAKPLLAYQDQKMFDVQVARIPFCELCTAGPRAVPFLERALGTATGDAKVVVAQALAVLGSQAGVSTLIAKIENMLAGLKKVPPRTNKILYTEMPPDQGAMPDVCFLLYNLGMARDKRALPVWRHVAGILEPREEEFREMMRSPFHYVDAICYGAERLGDPEAVPVLEALHSNPALKNQVSKKGFQLDYFQERQAMCELSIARALSRCGSAAGYSIAIEYLADARAMLAEQAHSHLIRVTGRDCGKDVEAWREWLEKSKSLLKPRPLVDDLDAAYETEILTA